jgi:hypothetical protein
VWVYGVLHLDPSFDSLQSFQILKDPHNSVRAYRVALATLPTSNLTTVQLQQKSQYEQAMARDQAIVDRPPRTLDEINPNAYIIKMNEKMPWAVAAEMIPELTRTKTRDSSVSTRPAPLASNSPLTTWLGMGLLRCIHCEWNRHGTLDACSDNRADVPKRCFLNQPAMRSRGQCYRKNWRMYGFLFHPAPNI